MSGEPPRLRRPPSRRSLTRARHPLPTEARGSTQCGGVEPDDAGIRRPASIGSMSPQRLMTWPRATRRYSYSKPARNRGRPGHASAGSCRTRALRFGGPAARPPPQPRHSRTHNPGVGTVTARSTSALPESAITTPSRSGRRMVDGVATRSTPVRRRPDAPILGARHDRCIDHEHLAPCRRVTTQDTTAADDTHRAGTLHRRYRHRAGGQGRSRRLPV